MGSKNKDCNMGKTIIDLVTGFLGAGKTTFILKYRTYCKGQGQKIHIIENEFCGYDVDTEILAQAGDKPSSLAGECLCCTGKEHFKELLLTCSSQGYDWIIVEPSGIYDVGEFFALFEDPEIAAVCQIGSIITIVDPAGLIELSEETEYLLFLQLLSAGTLLVSKTEVCKESLVRNVASTIARIMEKNGIPFDLSIHKDTTYHYCASENSIESMIIASSSEIGISISSLPLLWPVSSKTSVPSI